jgi:hypothetical protein
MVPSFEEAKFAGTNDAAVSPRVWFPLRSTDRTMRVLVVGENEPQLLLDSTQLCLHGIPLGLQSVSLGL